MTTRFDVLPYKETVVGLLGDAQRRGLFVPMPLWYAHYAPARPPDTLLPLRADLDSRFSAMRESMGDDDQLLSEYRSVDDQT